MVSFGELEGAKKWIKDAKLTKFSLIVDHKRILYNLFGLKRSFSRVWNTNTLVYYAEQMKLSRDLPQAYKDIHDDPHQMGGDFIVDTDNFKLLFAYRSRIPPDRPSVGRLLNEIEAFNNK